MPLIGCHLARIPAYFSVYRNASIKRPGADLIFVFWGGGGGGS